MDINNSNTQQPVPNLTGPTPSPTPSLSQLSHSYSDLDNLSKCIGNYINNSAFSDVIFLVGTRNQKVKSQPYSATNRFSQFFSHRFILAARSPVFNALFFVDEWDTLSDSPRIHDDEDSVQPSPRTGSTQLPITLELPDVDPRIFSEVLNYIYTGVVLLELDNIMEILSLANRFSMVPLQQLCENYLEAELGVTTANINTTSTSPTPRSASTQPARSQR